MNASELQQFLATTVQCTELNNGVSYADLNHGDWFIIIGALEDLGDNEQIRHISPVSSAGIWMKDARSNTAWLVTIRPVPDKPVGTVSLESRRIIQVPPDTLVVRLEISAP